jgi:SM-20-related protein
MPTADFFARLGLFVARDFLDTDLCAGIIQEAQASAWQRAEIYNPDPALEELSTTQKVRKSLKVRVPDVKRGLVVERLSAIMPALERHFTLKLTDFEEPQVLRYEKGHFFHGHRDSIPETNGDSAYERRRVSAVLFLNSQSDQPRERSYCGGSLVFAGLIDDPRARFQGFPLVGETGLLIAFRADTFHEVQPVTQGERYTVVTWFF